MELLIFTVIATLLISALCSLLEAVFLSTTSTDVEILKEISPQRGHILGGFRKNVAETSSAILALNTIANTLGSLIIGSLASQCMGEDSWIIFSIIITLTILFFGEILPKNMGILHRHFWQRHATYPLWLVCRIMSPFSLLFKHVIRLFLKHHKDGADNANREILLLAEKGANEGTLRAEEYRLIVNALSLDNTPIHKIMTPRIVVTALDQDWTLEHVFQEYKNLPFARIPTYNKTMDHIVGIVRRRDLLGALAEDKKQQKVADFHQKALFIPENATAADALGQFLKNQQQLAIVVDEFGSMAGVLTLEDLFEHILGQEIFEKDDIAIDMRALALKKKEHLIASKLPGRK